MPEFNIDNIKKQFYNKIAESKKRNRKIANNLVENPGNDDIDADYVMIYKDIDNIIDDIPEDIETKSIVRSIVDSLEKEAAIQLKAGKCVRIPFICTMARNNTAMVLQAHYKDFKERRTWMTKDAYNAYVKDVFYKAKLEENKIEEQKKNLLKLKKSVSKRYKRILEIHGETYANVWLLAVSFLKDVEFDEEVEEQYRLISEQNG